jgi:hypothetical protein
MLMILPLKLLWQRGVLKPANHDGEDEGENVIAPVRTVFAAAVPARVPVRVQIQEKPAIYISDNGAQVGPFTTAEIRHKVASGEISQEAWYWREGMQDWKGVWEITG